MATLLSLTPPPPKPPPNPIINPTNPLQPNAPSNPSRRNLFASLCALSLALFPVPASIAETASPPSKSILSGIANTKSWFQFYGSGFAIRVPPLFEDDYSAGLSLYGDKAKTKTYAARFQSPDGSEVLSVVIRPSNQLKITFLEAKDITDMGSLKEAAKFFVPGGSTLYAARTIKIKEEEGFRTYYFYEFGRDEEHFALVAAANSGKVFIAGAVAPQFKWDDDGVKLRSAAVSLMVL
ncbi:hypothetical protein RJ640_002221 [Escallonia rubra]|uniref:Photosystem II reaction center PsbP family protein n=1 Tax=Escallonia rubra TaxID=112253 RepID=A0AA88QVA5_9ASTE|nr:hypothetical protein RJ640_002221 [Escallonia rubra]